MEAPTLIFLGARVCATAADSPLSLPSLAPLPQLRLDSLSMEARLAVKTAAIIGETFTMALVARVCPELSVDQLEHAKYEVRRQF